MAIKESPKVIEDIVKFPGVTNAEGEIILAGPEYKGLDYKILAQFASITGGRVVSVAFPVRYTQGDIVCSHNGCFMSPVDGDRCADHKLGRKS